jgi:hypothetical protein
MSEDYFASFFEIDSDPVPDDAKYGGGLEFDKQWERQTATNPVTDGFDDGENDDVQPPQETPAWVDDARGLIRDDLTPTGDDIDDLQFRCETDIENLARGVFNIVELPNDSAWFQLLERHGLRCIGSEHESGRFGNQIWHWHHNGLQLKVSGDVQERDDGYLSYLNIRGPEQAVTSFTEDLLTLATWIKRELRAPSPVAVANAAEESGGRVPDDERLVDRSRTANVVRRLPRAETDGAGDDGETEQEGDR